MKKQSITVIILLLLLLSFFSYNNKIFSQENKSITTIVNIRLLTSTPIEVGDPIDILLSITTKKGMKIEYPKNNRLFSPFLLRNYFIKRKIRDNKIELLVYYTITSLNPGKVTLPPLPITVDNRIIKTKPIEIKVQTTTGNKKKDINDINGPLKNYKIFIFIIPILILIALFILFNIIKLPFFRKGKIGIINHEERNITYDPILTSILYILSLKEDKKINIREKYYILSRSLKKFMEGIFKINLMSLTTNRIKRLLHNFLSVEHFTYLSKKLDRYDKIKYSKNVFNNNYKNELEENFPEETKDLVIFLYQILKNHYQKIFEIIV